MNSVLRSRVSKQSACPYLRSDAPISADRNGSRRSLRTRCRIWQALLGGRRLARPRRTRSVRAARKSWRTGSNQIQRSKPFYRLSRKPVTAALSQLTRSFPAAESTAVVAESAITGSSAPVVREAARDRCVVTGGTDVGDRTRASRALAVILGSGAPGSLVGMGFDQA